MGGEGQNHVIVTSQPVNIPYGQALNGSGDMEKTFTNEYGSYAIMDLASCYPGVVNYARRGMLYTNNRKTVVYQDEIGFRTVQDFAWIAHTEAYSGTKEVKKIVLSDDKTTAWITATGYNEATGKNDASITIRCSILATIQNKYKFEIMDC